MLRAAQRYRLSGISIQKTTENLLTNQILLDSIKKYNILMNKDFIYLFIYLLNTVVIRLGTENVMVGDPW